MSIHIKGTLFGIEIPAMTDLVKTMRTEGYTQERTAAYQKLLEDNRPLFRQVNEFLLKNGAPTPFGPVAVAEGYISHSAKETDIPCGITFYASDELAQKVANQFSGYKVISAADGKLIAPLQKKTPQPRKPSGPKF